MRLSQWRIRKKFGRWRVYKPGRSIYMVYSGETHAQALIAMASLREAERRG
jgi:hypothetical protein